MRVAYPMRVDALDKPGGDVELMRIYIHNCELAAQRNGTTFEGEILTDLDPDLSRFDAVHLTNTDRPVDLYCQFEAARRVGKPVLITPLHHSYREIERYERFGRGGLIGMFSGWLGFNRLELLRILVKSRRYRQLRPALWRVLRVGVQSAQAEVLQGCSFVLVAADKEATDIANDIAPLSARQIVKVRNGFLMPSIPPAPSGERDIDIAVIARVESRKNQVAILEAVEQLGLKATFVGPVNPNHKRYADLLREKIAKSRSSYIPGVAREQVALILARSRVHVAASWFEVSSLVDIEAYVLGCRVVASVCGGTRELLGDDAYYVDPGSTTDIANKIAAAMESVGKRTVNTVQRLSHDLETWQQVGVRLLHLYAVSTAHLATVSAEDRV